MKQLIGRPLSGRKVLALSVALAAAYAGSASAGASDLVVSIGSSERALREGSSEITVTLSNPSRETIRVVRWQTPIEGVYDDLFEVTLNGEPVTYTGRHAKWGTPGDKDFIELAPGAVRTSVIDLVRPSVCERICVCEPRGAV